MEIHPLVLIGSVAIPLVIITAIVFLTSVVRRKSLKDQEIIREEQNKSAEKDTELVLFEELVSKKEKHIDFLQKKTKR